MPWASAAAIVGGAGIASALIGKSSADKAARIQADATREGVEETRRQYDATRADLAPYREAGVAALTRLRELAGIDTNPETSPLLRKFTTEDLNADPVYQTGLNFGLTEGEKAIERRQAARGGYDSGAALKELTRYGTDYSSQRAGEAYGRFRDIQDSQFSKLAGVTGIGTGATNVGVNAGTTTAGNLANLYSGLGNAQGAAAIAGGNALSGGLNSIANFYGQSSLLKQLTGGGQRSTTPDMSLLGE